MNSFVYYQLYIFLAAIYGGVVIAFLYDVYKVLRSYFKVHRNIRIVQDVLFWLSISIVAIYVLLYSSNGDLKAGSIVGFFIGAILYKILLSKYITILAHKIISLFRGMLIKMVSGIKKIYSKIICLLLLPIKVLLKIFTPIIKKASKKSKRIKSKVNTKILVPSKNKKTKIKNSVLSKYKKHKIAQIKKRKKIEKNKLSTQKPPIKKSNSKKITKKKHKKEEDTSQI